jgi:hypothetical protein
LKLRRGTRRRGAIVLLCVVAVHLALAWSLLDSIAPRQATPAPLQRMTMRLIPETTAAPRRAAEPPPNPPAVARWRALPSARTPSPTIPAATRRAEAALPELASRSEPAASAPPAVPSLMDTEATRRAIRDSARQPAHIGHVAGAGAGDDPRRASTQERLAADVKAAGKGDCVKGEYLGAGAGLLSVPFLALAAARGACAR